MKAEEVVWQGTIEFHNIVMFPERAQIFSTLHWSPSMCFSTRTSWNMEHVFHPGKIMLGGL